MADERFPELSILIVEDDALEVDLFRRTLRSIRGAAREPLHVTGVAAAIELFAKSKIDLVFLDLNVADSEGLDTVRRITRAKPPGTVVIVVSSMKDRALAIESLKLGAQDYVVKGEYSQAELSRATLHALARAAPGTPGESAKVRIDFTRLKLISSAKGGVLELELTATELKLASLFVEKMGEVVSRERIHEAVLGAGSAVSERTIDNQVSRFRAKVEPLGLHVRSVRGVGYKLETD